MLTISNDARLIAGITLITVPTIEFGGVFLLKMLRTREPGYMDNPLRQNLFRAGHAHAGVIVILSLICQVLVDSIYMSPPFVWFVRLGVPGAAILISLGFFLSVAPPRVERPTGAINLVYIGAVVLAIAVLILGIGLVRAGLS
ncbi:MAG TPA: hypothetical protein VLV89_12595 [Candidatus Acidoferrum sp.]|nr:hypothetical protein [Candidatus Acidoferrum sp.]